MDVKGGCSPQNIFETADVLIELSHCPQQISLIDLKRRSAEDCNKLF